MSSDGISVEIKLTDGSGAVKARAEVRIDLDEGTLLLLGFTVIEKNGKPPWVGFPSKAGKIPGKYFPMMEADGEIREMIVRAILEAYQTVKAA
jgi:DNA-binding cell septation regulator SpoVG